MTDLSNSRQKGAGACLVLGMGATGLSLARWWVAEGHEVVAADDRAAPPMRDVFARELPQVQCLCGENFGAWSRQRFAGFARVGVSPGVAPERLNAAPEALTNDAAIFSEAWQAEAPADSKLLAVTGTNGKSTAAALAAHLAGGQAVGNIGAPMLDAFAAWRQEGFPKTVAVELSSFQLQLAPRFASDVAVALNASEDHLDRHGTMEAYLAIKRSVYNACECAVVNVAPGGVWPADEDLPFTTFDGRLRGGDVWAHWLIERGEWAAYGEDKFALRDMSCAARENPDALLAALAMLDEAGRVRDCMKKVAARLASFAGLPHRRALVGEFGGVRYVNDSKATNVGAALYSLRQEAAAGRRCVWIGGGDGKGQDFAPLAAAAGGMRAALLLGQDGGRLADVVAAAGVMSAVVRNMDDAVMRAELVAQAGDTVLLAPACSSLDMFDDFAARGEAFAAAARKEAADNA